MRALALGAVLGSVGALRLALPVPTVFGLLWSLGLVSSVLVGARLLARLRDDDAHRGSGGRCAARLARALRSASFGACIGVLVGAWWTLLAAQALGERVLDARLAGVDVVLAGRIADVPRWREGRVSFEFAVERAVNVPEGVTFAPRTILLGRRGGAALHAGERWELTARLRPVRGLRNAGGFDRVRYLLSRRIDASGYVRDVPPMRKLGEGGGGNAMRQRLAERLDALDQGGGASTSGADDADSGTGEAGATASRPLALVKALTIGLAHEVPEATRELLRDSGTAHLLAISGLHVTLVAGWGVWGGRALARASGAESGRAAAVGLVAGALLAAAYALLAGFGLPTRRALVMLLVALAAGYRLRALTPGTALAAASLGVLAIDPLAPLAVGFWLSFGTVAALLWLHAGRIRDERVGRAGRLVALLRTHCLLGVVLLPVTAWFFQSGSWVAPLANAVAVPFTAIVIVPLAFLTLALAVLWPWAAGFALAAFDASSATLLAGLDALLERVDGAWTLALPSFEVLACCLAGLAVLLAPPALLPRRFALFLILPALLANISPPRPEGFEVHVLDVGQGLAVLVLTENETWLYDTGDRISPSLSMLEAVVVPYLHALGRRRIDTLVVSHPDSDHAAGTEDALRRWPALRVIAGARDADTPDGAIDCRAGQSELHDGVRFSFLHPAAHDTGSENDSSCVLLVHFGDSRALLSGDIERVGEARLLARAGVGAGEGLPVTLMTAPHHGSRTSSSEALVRAFAPTHVVFPAGADNRYGFPHESVQMRYKAVGAVTHVTGRDGAIRFEFDAVGLVRAPVSWRSVERRFWHDLVEPGWRSDRR